MFVENKIKKFIFIKIDNFVYLWVYKGVGKSLRKFFFCIYLMILFDKIYIVVEEVLMLLLCNMRNIYFGFGLGDWKYKKFVFVVEIMYWNIYYLYIF